MSLVVGRKDDNRDAKFGIDKCKCVKGSHFVNISLLR